MRTTLIALALLAGWLASAPPARAQAEDLGCANVLDAADAFFFVGGEGATPAICQRTCTQLFVMCATAVESATACNRNVFTRSIVFQITGFCSQEEDPASRRECIQFLYEDLRFGMQFLRQDRSDALEQCREFRDDCAFECGFDDEEF